MTSALLIMPSMTAPTQAPATEALPPLMLVPPRTVAAIAEVSSASPSTVPLKTFS